MAAYQNELVNDLYKYRHTVVWPRDPAATSTEHIVFVLPATSVAHVRTYTFNYSFEWGGTRAQMENKQPLCVRTTRSFGARPLACGLETIINNFNSI